MNILGLNFTKIEAQRKESGRGKINIKNNVTITDVQEADLAVEKEKQKVLRFLFEFTSTYDPKIGNITINGNLLLMDEIKKIDNVMASWKKEKKVTKEVMTPLLNTILTRCNIEALILSQQINLPPPIPLPKVQVGSKQG